MNAPHPLSADKRPAERKAYEPSMEEILASIKRIIADDQASAPKQNSGSRPAPQEPTFAPPAIAERAAPAPLAPPSVSGYPVDGQFQFFKTAVAPGSAPQDYPGANGAANGAVHGEPGFADANDAAWPEAEAEGEAVEAYDAEAYSEAYEDEETGYD